MLFFLKKGGEVIVGGDGLKREGLKLTNYDLRLCSLCFGITNFREF